MSAYGKRKKIKNYGELSGNEMPIEALTQGFVFGNEPLVSSFRQSNGQATSSVQNSLPTFPLEIPRPQKKKVKPPVVPKKKQTPAVQHVEPHSVPAHFEVKKVKIGTQEFFAVFAKEDKSKDVGILLHKKPDGKRKEK